MMEPEFTYLMMMKFYSLDMTLSRNRFRNNLFAISKGQFVRTFGDFRYPTPPIPFTWSLPLVTVDEIAKWEEDYQKGEPVCEIIAFNQNADGMWYGLEDWHDAIVLQVM